MGQLFVFIFILHISSGLQITEANVASWLSLSNLIPNNEHDEGHQRASAFMQEHTPKHDLKGNGLPNGA